MVHTTAWDAHHDFNGRAVGLIGTGATAVQLIPELAKTVGDLTVYQRTPIWVAPKLDFGFSPSCSDCSRGFRSPSGRCGG